LVHGEVRGGEYHKGRIEGVAMEVRVFTLLRDLLGVLGFTVAVCKVEAIHVKFRVLPFKMKIQNLTLIGCA
jgi:hypothetical protein